jgi:thymidylate synthase ThyX
MHKRMLGTTKLMVVDDLSPEDVAMLQALYSRSAESAEVHLDKIYVQRRDGVKLILIDSLYEEEIRDKEDVGALIDAAHGRSSKSEKFMASYYVGYGHKSIADCGSTTMFIENVSLLAAKAIQDWPLYSGQETSTRYIDMSKQEIVDPVGTSASRAILDAWMAFYTESQDSVAATVRQKYPIREGEKPDVYEKAVKARTFDILRGFLPAGIKTQLSWHTNIRQAGDHLIGLTKHPSAEIRDLSLQLRDLLGACYPSSGLGLNLASVSGVSNRDAEAAAAREKWEAEVASELTYFSTVEPQLKVSMYTDPELNLVGVGQAARRLLHTRPRGCVVPHEFARLGMITFRFDMDFGSFRDLQRHRNGVCRMPLLGVNHGFEDWYLRELGDLESKGRELVERLKHDAYSLTNDPIARQYYLGLGFKVPCQISYGLPATIYMLELRSGKHIHPTYRSKVHEMIRLFVRQFPDLALHVDTDPDDWTVRRGLQTIEKR